MQKERKDGKYFNCYIKRKLLEEFEVVCKIQGKTKTSVLEEAMQLIVDPFYNRGESGLEEPVIDPRPGVYMHNGKEIPCVILDDRIICGKLHYCIWADNTLVTVPAEMVTEQRLT